MSESDNGLFILLISVHGLIRGDELELGRDADTGGQTKYVVELARALGQSTDVAHVDLVTRQIFDAKVSNDYQQPSEQIGNKAWITRIPCGPRRYLRKEVLWPYLDAFRDNILKHLRRLGRVPDVIHAHYADAGYVGAHLASLLGVPFIFTGHSLGREKLRRLLDKGQKLHNIEKQYNISQRIDAEEQALDSAAMVVASTAQEVEEQYSIYDFYQPDEMAVIPPGVDLSRFKPPRKGDDTPAIMQQIDRFLTHPKKPMILAVSRADERKNILTLIEAYAENETLREQANLVIIAGNRDDIQHMDKGARHVLENILFTIDKYDLYGMIAFPKHHTADDIPELYRHAARLRGVFINPALTEPFGLTIIEAAASGLPVVATNDGGPSDIIGYCKNGILIDPLDKTDISAALLSCLSDKTRWSKYSRSGIKGVHQHYSWAGHCQTYIKRIKQLLKGRRHRLKISKKNRLPTTKRIIICDIDNTLIGGEDGALDELMQRLHEMQPYIGFGVATGRHLESTLEVLKANNISMPDLLITSVGSEIYYGHRMVQDVGWYQHISHKWQPNAIRDALKELPGLKLQQSECQRSHKISYYVDMTRAPSKAKIVQHLRKKDIHANVIHSHEAYLDILPIRASKGLALRYLGIKWGIDPEEFLVAGDSGNDEEMLLGNTLGVVVGNYSSELEKLRGKPNVYFASGYNANGILEGIEYYNFI